MKLRWRPAATHRRVPTRTYSQPRGGIRTSLTMGSGTIVVMVAPGPNGPRFTDVGRLVVRCPDRPGIVAVLSGLMADVGANIIDSQQHSSDPVGGTFTLRLEFFLADLGARRQQLEGALALLAQQWQFTWRL